MYWTVCNILLNIRIQGLIYIYILFLKCLYQITIFVNTEYSTYNPVCTSYLT